VFVDYVRFNYFLFQSKAEEDLYLTGSENTIRRVTAETNYSCLMLKTQRFSSLFRHYAKYHGLRKDDLEYYFVNPLENEDTPESVQLQRGDTIMVRKRRRPDPPEAASNDDEFFKDMRELLDDEEHMDVVFLVHDVPIVYSDVDGYSANHNNKNSNNSVMDVMETPKKLQKTISTMETSDDDSVIPRPSIPHKPFGTNNNNNSNTSTHAANTNTSSNTNDRHSTQNQKPTLVEIPAHKCILTARTDYFKAFFRKDGFKESSSGKIHVDPHFSTHIVRLMLEFIYTNRIQTISDASTDDLITILDLSNQWLMRDLKRLVEIELKKSHLDVNRVARLYCAGHDFNAMRLQKACIDYIMENYREVTGSEAFQDEMKHYPQLCLPILSAAADLIPEPLHKKQRIDHVQVAAGVGISTPNNSAPLSSPVPDSDP